MASWGKCNMDHVGMQVYMYKLLLVAFSDYYVTVRMSCEVTSQTTADNPAAKFCRQILVVMVMSWQTAERHCNGSSSIVSHMSACILRTICADCC